MIIYSSEAFEVIWIGWVVSWIAASVWSGRTAKRAATYKTWLYRIVIFTGAILIARLGQRRRWATDEFGRLVITALMRSFA